MMETWENGKKPNFGLNFEPPTFFVSFTSADSRGILIDIVPSCHPMQFKEKLMNQSWKKWQET